MSIMFLKTFNRAITLLIIILVIDCACQKRDVQLLVSNKNQVSRDRTITRKVQLPLIIQILMSKSDWSKTDAKSRLRMAERVEIPVLISELEDEKQSKSAENLPISNSGQEESVKPKDLATEFNIPILTPRQDSHSHLSWIFPAWPSLKKVFTQLFPTTSHFTPLQRSRGNLNNECTDYDKRIGSLGFSTFFQSRMYTRKTCQDIRREYSHLLTTEPYRTSLSRVCHSLCLKYGFARGECERDGAAVLTSDCVCFQDGESSIGLKLEPLDISNKQDIQMISQQVPNYYFNPCTSCACSWQCEKSGFYVGYCGEDICYCGNPWIRGVLGNLLIDWDNPAD